MRLLIIEDELPMRTALADCLEAGGYRVMTAADGASGLDRARREKPDLILLDVMMPKLDGFAVCQELRRLGLETPILMLTAKSQVQDKVIGFNAGADDYLVKPFSMDELLARVRALLRRVQKVSTPVAVCEMGRLKVDFKSQQAWEKGKPAHLTAKEMASLKLLVEAKGEPVTREKFLDIVWGYGAFPTTRTVDNHVANLRAKIEKNPEKPTVIETVHGVGYRVNPEQIITKS